MHLIFSLYKIDNLITLNITTGFNLEYSFEVLINPKQILTYL
jgi:hypothetical protein